MMRLRSHEPTRTQLRLGLVFVALFAALPATAGSAFVPRQVHLVMRKASEKQASGGTLRARLDEPVLLHAAVEGTLDGRTVVICEAPAVILNGRAVPADRLKTPAAIPGLARYALRWFKVQATGKSYDNTVGGFHWETIRYLEQPLDGAGGLWSRPADAHPIGDYPDTHGGAGTMAFKVELIGPGGKLASPGADSSFRGGLGEDVPRVALRRDDTFVGRLTELFNTPYIWGSAGVPPRVHQAERLIGSDCADFVVYGARRLGKDLPYRASWHLPLVATTVARGQRVSKKGLFLDEKGEPLAIAEAGVHVGDLLLFHGHVGALAADREPEGVLDTNDIIIHTYWAPPDEEAIRDTAYGQAQVQVLRWK